MSLLIALALAVAMQDHGAHMHPMATPPAAPPAEASAPPVPTDHATDAIYTPAEMAASRALLRDENGGMPSSMILVDRLEYQPQAGRDAYRWEGEAWFGGDIDRLTIKTKGEGEVGGTLNEGEVQALWSHATDPWFNIQLGVRRDFARGPKRNYAVFGVEGLAPFWFELEGAAFLSDHGDLTARFEASHDIRLTQRLLLQPHVELNLSAQDVPAQRIGAGISSAEAGLRLHYLITPRLAPYVGVNWHRSFGDTARFVRAQGDAVTERGMVAGIRFWF